MIFMVSRNFAVSSSTTPVSASGSPTCTHTGK